MNHAATFLRHPISRPLRFPVLFLFTLFPFLCGLLLLILVLDACDLAADGVHLHLRDRPHVVAYVERINKLTVLALQLAALDIARRTLEGRLSRLLHRNLGLTRQLLLRLRLFLSLLMTLRR